MIFDITDCQKMKTTSVNNGWFKFSYAVSNTISFDSNLSLKSNIEYNLSEYNYLRLLFELPEANYDNGNISSLGNISFE